MLDKYQILTVTHHNLNIADIGSFSCTERDEMLVDALNAIKLKFDIEELSYLTTCNRVAFLVYRNEVFNAQEIVAFFKTVNPNLNITEDQNFINHYVGEQAVMHYMEVASSMDSLVVGEREIFRQLRNAYEYSRQQGLTGDKLRLLNQHMVVSAKEVYAKTRIGEKPLSVVSLAIQKIKQKSLAKDAKILLIGAGETNTLVGKFLLKNEYNNVVIFNRSLNNATELSSMLSAPAFHLTSLEKYNEGFDAIFICTSSNDTIIKKELYQKLVGSDTGQKLIVDLAVPRNIDQDVIDGFNVSYIDIEQLRKLAEVNLEFRKSEVVKAKVYLDSSLESFKQLYLERNLEEALKAVPNEIKDIKKRAMNAVFKDKIEVLDPQSQALISEMMDYMEKKCISVPMKAAKSILS